MRLTGSSLTTHVTEWNCGRFLQSVSTFPCLTFLHQQSTRVYNIEPYPYEAVQVSPHSCRRRRHHYHYHHHMCGYKNVVSTKTWSRNFLSWLATTVSRWYYTILQHTTPLTTSCVLSVTENRNFRILDKLCFQTCRYTVLSDGAPEYFVGGGSSECKIKCLWAFIIV